MPKTIALTSLKAKEIQEVANQANQKVQKKVQKKRKLLEPLSSQKVVDPMRKTETGFLDSSMLTQSEQKDRYQPNRLNPLEHVSQPATSVDNHDEMCDCQQSESGTSQSMGVRVIKKSKKVVRDQTRVVCEVCGGIVNSLLTGSQSQATIKKKQ